MSSVNRWTTLSLALHVALLLVIFFWSPSPTLPQPPSGELVAEIDLTGGGQFTSMIKEKTSQVKKQNDQEKKQIAAMAAEKQQKEMQEKLLREQNEKVEKEKAQAEQKEKEQAEAKEKELAEAREKSASEAKAKEIADEKEKAQLAAMAAAKAKADADAKAQKLAEAKEAEAREKAKSEAKKLAEAKTKAEADAKAKKLAEAKTKAEADAKAKKLAEAKTKAEADAKAKKLAEAKAKADADAKAKQAAFEQQLAAKIKAKNADDTITNAINQASQNSAGSATKTASSQNKLGAGLSFSDKDALINQMTKCWTEQGATQSAVVDFDLNQAGVPSNFAHAGGDRIAYLMAQDAIRKCGPYTNLPMASHDAWKNLRVKFSPFALTIQ